MITVSVVSLLINFKLLIIRLTIKLVKRESDKTPQVLLLMLDYI